MWAGRPQIFYDSDRDFLESAVLALMLHHGDPSDEVVGARVDPYKHSLNVNS